MFHKQTVDFCFDVSNWSKTPHVVTLGLSDTRRFGEASKQGGSPAGSRPAVDVHNEPAVRKHGRLARFHSNFGDSGVHGNTHDVISAPSALQPFHVFKLQVKGLQDRQLAQH